jgi:hypothetical protein
MATAIPAMGNGKFTATKVDDKDGQPRFRIRFEKTDKSAVGEPISRLAENWGIQLDGPHNKSGGVTVHACGAMVQAYIGALEGAF